MIAHRNNDFIVGDDADGYGGIRDTALSVLDRYTPVSYTHLDVYKRQVHIFTKRVTSGTETYRVNRRRVTRDKNPRIWYTLKLSSTGFVMSDSLVERKGASDEQHRKLLYERYGRLTFREGKIIFLNSRCPAFYVKKEEK